MMQRDDEFLLVPWRPEEVLLSLTADQANRRRAQLTDASDPRCRVCGALVARDGRHWSDHHPDLGGVVIADPEPEPTPEPEHPANVISLTDRVRKGR